MKGVEFLKTLKALAGRKGWSYEWRPNEGKGSHGALYVNGQKTIVRNLKDELKTGTSFTARSSNWASKKVTCINRGIP